MNVNDSARPSGEAKSLARSRAFLLGGTVLIVSAVAVLSAPAFAAQGGAGGSAAGSSGGKGGDTGQAGATSPSGGPGGAAGAAPGAPGAPGAAGGGRSGGGGGGGANGAGPVNGGGGGDGGDADPAAASSVGGGGGGGGGNGNVVGAGGTLNAVTVSGGAGGDGGDGVQGTSPGPANGGDGGAGGAGIDGTATGAGVKTINIGPAVTISGGDGGDGGTGAGGGLNGAAGAGGVGIVGQDLNITNSGTIQGGVAGGAGGAQADAIQFTGGTNVLTITSTSTITGNVTGADANDTFGLGGTTPGAFNLSQIGTGTKYGAFGTLQKSGTSTWTLSGTPASTLNYVVDAGTLNLGGTTQSTPSFILNGGTLSNGTLTLTGTSATAADVRNGSVSAVLAGTGGLTKSTGTAGNRVILSGANTYSGGTQVNDGALAVTGAGTLGATTSSTTVGNTATPATLTALDLGGTAQTQATLTVNSGATVTSTTGGLGVTNAAGSISVGTFTMTGGAIAAPVTVTATGTTTGTGHQLQAGTVNGVLAGAGALTKTTAGTVILNNTNTYTGGTSIEGGTVRLTGTGTLGATTGSTTVSNAAILDLGGISQTQAQLTQNDTSTVRTTVGAAGATANTATVTVGAYTLNGGTLASGVTVSASGTTATTGHQMRSGTVNGVLAGAATLTKTTAGTVTLSNTNTYTGATAVNAGTLAITSTGSVVSAVTTAANATTDLAGDVFNTFTNNGTLIMSSGATISGVLTNNANALTTVSGASTVGSISNAGRISMQNGVFGDSLSTTAGGAYTATGAARLDLDFNNVAPNGAQDTLDVNGTATGSTSVFFREFGARQLFAPKTVIFTDNGAPAQFTGVFVDSNGDPVANGLIAYSLQRQGNNWAVVSNLDASGAGAAAGAVTSSIVAVGTGFVDAATAFISAPANPEPDQTTFGFWGRTKGGKYDIDTDTKVDVPGGTNSSDSTTFRTSFWGYQFGADIGRLNVGGSGFNFHGGLTAGDVDIDTRDKNGGTKASTKAPFIGIYGAVTGHGFFADLQIQRNFYKTKLDVPVANLDNEKVKGRGYSIIFSGGKVIPLSDTWFIEPSVGLNYVRVDTNDVPFAGVGAVKIKDVESLLGRLGLRVGTSFQATESLILRPAIAASVWREFKNDAKSNFDFDPGVAGGGVSNADISTSRVGTFGQIGVSLSGQMTNSPVLGFVRADYRKGANIQGYALTGGLRTQF